MIRAVLLDAAGTLIRLAEPVGETYARLARARGLELSPQLADSAFRSAVRAMPAMVFPGETAAEVRRRERLWWRDVAAQVVGPLPQVILHCVEHLFPLVQLLGQGFYLRGRL